MTCNSKSPSFQDLGSGRRAAPGPGPAFAFVLFTLLTLLSAREARAESTIRLGDGFTVVPYGLGQLDAASFSQSQPGGQSAGLNVRRARVGGRLNALDQVELGLIWDFGHTPGSIGKLFEAKASYIGIKPFTITAGVFKTNFSLESMQSAGEYLFMERASIVTITSNLAAGIRREGIQLQANGDRYNLSIAGTAGTAGLGRDGGQRAIVGRAAGLVYQTATTAVHTGISGEWVLRPANSSGVGPALSFSDQTELAVDDVMPALSTGKIATKNVAAIGPELGATWNRLWLQAEYYEVLLNRQASAGGGKVTFDGWYAQAAYTLIGRHREWESSFGGWGRPKPAAALDPSAGQFGALEVGIRFSTVNLNYSTVRGGRQSVVSAGVNWWPVEPLRLTLIYEHGMISGGIQPRALDAIGARGQIQF